MRSNCATDILAPEHFAAADGLTDKVADMQADGVAGDWSQGVRTV